MEFWPQEIVPLRKVCRRPETDYRLQQLHAVNDAASPMSSADAFPAGARPPATLPPETVHRHVVADVTPPVLPAPISEPRKSEPGILESANQSSVDALVPAENAIATAPEGKS